MWEKWCHQPWVRSISTCHGRLLRSSLCASWMLNTSHLTSFRLRMTLHLSTPGSWAGQTLQLPLPPHPVEFCEWEIEKTKQQQNPLLLSHWNFRFIPFYQLISSNISFKYLICLLLYLSSTSMLKSFLFRAKNCNQLKVSSLYLLVSDMMKSHWPLFYFIFIHFTF